MKKRELKEQGKQVSKNTSVIKPKKPLKEVI
jgi:hypothetical protein